MLTTNEFHKARLSRDIRFDGKFFVGVKTTGIFCRPICPARLPAEQNVEYLQSAESALQAGYRPCIRCRPDSAPQSWAWLGTQTTVQRAARLIAEQPAQPLGALTERLGIGERHLRALFDTHLGMSPKQYQLCQRLLFAKQLLQDCNLPVTAVAHASGFNSARALQLQFRKRLDLSPLQLRRQRTEKPADIRLRLAYRPPYNWTYVRDFLARRAIPLLETYTDNTFVRSFELDGARGHFTAQHCPERHCFDVTIDITDLQKLKPLLGSIRRVLDLDADPQGIADSLHDAGIHYKDQLLGIRLPGIWSQFEAGCRAICGQQVSVTAAVNQVSRLVEHLGKQPGSAYVFPSPAKVARSNLAFLGMPATRKDTLRAYAGIMSRPDKPDTAGLLNLKGIGQWTVDYIRMRGMSDSDVFLANDLVVKRQVDKLPMTQDRAAPWPSYLTLQLWSMA